MLRGQLVAPRRRSPRTLRFDPPIFSLGACPLYCTLPGCLAARQTPGATAGKQPAPPPPPPPPSVTVTRHCRLVSLVHAAH
jgi:hypothetical protein